MEHHSHGHSQSSYGRAFAIGIALNLAYVGGEAVAGIFSGSLALLADAGHNLGDVLGLSLSWGAAVLSRRQPSGRFTYGLRSSSILAALANAIILLGRDRRDRLGGDLAHQPSRAGRKRHRRRGRSRRHFRQWRDGAALFFGHWRPQCKKRLFPPGGRCPRHRRCRGRRYRDLADQLAVARSAGQPRCFSRHRLRHLGPLEERHQPGVGCGAGRPRPWRSARASALLCPE